MRQDFEFDEYARRHLREWFDYGSAPSDWDLGTLDAFVAWVEVHGSEWPDDASWPSMARAFDLAVTG